MVDMNAFYQPGRGGRGGRGGGARGARGSSRGGPRTSASTGREWTVKFCRLCKEKGKPEAIIASHNTVNCNSFSRSELRALLVDLQAMDLDPYNQDEDTVEGGIEYGYDHTNQGDQSQGQKTESS